MDIFIGKAKLDNYVLAIENKAIKDLEGNPVAYHPTICTNTKYFEQIDAECSEETFNILNQEMNIGKYPLMVLDANSGGNINGQTYVYLENNILNKI